MFILKRVTNNNNESYNIIGESYNIVSKRHNKEDFERTENNLKFPHLESIYAFIVYNNGVDILPLYANSSYYIMISNGQTFINISEKEGI